MNGLFDGLFAGVAEAGPGMAIRATVLFVVASLVSLALTKASAAQRHLVWVAALMGAMVLPAIHAWGPEWAVWPAGMIYRYGATSERGGVATRPERTMPDDRLQVVPLSHDPVPGESTTALAAAGVSGRVEATSPATATLAGSSRTVLLAHGMAAVWLVGAILGCVRLAVAYAGIRQLARHADPADGRTAAMIAELAAAAGIRRRVRGLVSRESIVPLTWGWLRPVVLLPAEAGSWSAERLRVVLQHELAHVSRWDALTQFVAEVARSVYWFHPLSWWSLRRLRAEQEAACDDCVLIAGAAADDYAEELLAVTARLPRGAYGLHGTGVAVAMGRAGRLEERVRALLAFDRDRRPVNPWRAAAVAGVFAAVATLAAIIGPAADAEDKAASGPAEPSASADDELPADTDKSESLRPEEARRWAKEFQGVNVEGEVKGHSKGLYLDCLPLNGLKFLDAKTAKALAGYSKGPLLLNGLTALNADTAKALAEFKGDILFLSGLTTLDAATAKALAELKGYRLDLNGLTTLDADTAKALAEFKGAVLFLNGLTTLDADTAKAIAAFQGDIILLSGLTTLDADTAKALAEFKGDFLILDGLTSLDANTAKAIADFTGRALSLGNLPTLNAETAKALAELKGMQLVLNGLTTLDADTAKALVAAQKWDGQLPKLMTFDSPDSVAIALALATRKGPLSLPNLKKISPKTLSALTAKEDVEIPLIETLELIQEPDGSPTNDFIIPEGFKQQSR